TGISCRNSASHRRKNALSCGGRCPKLDGRVGIDSSWGLEVWIQMDEATFKERVKRLNEINKVVEKLDPAIREQAFALLESYVGTGKVTHGRESGGES